MIDSIKIASLIVLAFAIGVAGSWYVFGGSTAPSDSFGVSRNGISTITNPWVFTQGATLTGDGSTGSKTLTVTTTNTATSTITGGCFQFYATSTATAQKFQASTTPGIMYSSYGACPNL